MAFQSVFLFQFYNSSSRWQVQPNDYLVNPCFVVCFCHAFIGICYFLFTTQHMLVWSSLVNFLYSIFCVIFTLYSLCQHGFICSKKVSFYEHSCFLNCFQICQQFFNHYSVCCYILKCMTSLCITQQNCFLILSSLNYPYIT